MLKVNKYICDGCQNCAIGPERYWMCRELRLKEQSLAPLWCPVYKAQVDNVPCLVLTANTDMYRRLERNVRSMSDMRINLIHAHSPDRIRGLQRFEIWYASAWQKSPMILKHENRAFLQCILSYRKQ